ncbi:Methyltransferase domain [Rubrobacter radiotolerans]|uniref:Class I SAM-dependent methyltransferase n=1 Tax=Rubrobacter radiotolerans TaxID=42256 RepID=A0A023X001_RUBRA|nr:class I SAM-dependent methyltransferase [Rubrobacter radiotolerans]AHY45807.1 Methyltransferase domain [Rubrobacter radiotolerans]MDX5893221.1 class I SAM-dependent methyltransferase [Rubrobacter radiotolerans]SMC03306.1 Methyltransferase domain-containing protein [Rubrobacter radiotolerans DSM 5868]
MTGPGDPLTAGERDRYERDLIAFSDRELDRLGDVRGRSLLYAGGTSPVWIEGLAERLGPSGSLTVLDLDRESLAVVREGFAPDDLPLAPRYVFGDVFGLPFSEAAFDLVYSSGLLHELDVGGRPDGPLGALREMYRVARPGGVVLASDFVSDPASGVPAAQVEEETIVAEVARLLGGARLFGIGPAARLEEAASTAFPGSRVERHPPFPIRHLDRLFLAQPEPEGLGYLSPDAARPLRARWQALRGRVAREGYTRPATATVRISRV